MVDATDLKSVVHLGVRVRVPPSAPLKMAYLRAFALLMATIFARALNDELPAACNSGVIASNMPVSKAAIAVSM